MEYMSEINYAHWVKDFPGNANSGTPWHPWEIKGLRVINLGLQMNWFSKATDRDVTRYIRTEKDDAYSDFSKFLEARIKGQNTSQLEQIAKNKLNTLLQEFIEQNTANQASDSLGILRIIDKEKFLPIFLFLYVNYIDPAHFVIHNDLQKADLPVPQYFLCALDLLYRALELTISRFKNRNEFTAPYFYYNDNIAPFITFIQQQFNTYLELLKNKPIENVVATAETLCVANATVFYNTLRKLVPDALSKEVSALQEYTKHHIYGSKSKGDLYLRCWLEIPADFREQLISLVTSYHYSTMAPNLLGLLETRQFVQLQNLSKEKIALFVKNYNFLNDNSNHADFLKFLNEITDLPAVSAGIECVFKCVKADIVVTTLRAQLPQLSRITQSDVDYLYDRTLFLTPEFNVLQAIQKFCTYSETVRNIIKKVFPRQEKNWGDVVRYFDQENNSNTLSLEKLSQLDQKNQNLLIDCAGKLSSIAEKTMCLKVFREATDNQVDVIKFFFEAIDTKAHAFELLNAQKNKLCEIYKNPKLFVQHINKLTSLASKLELVEAVTAATSEADINLINDILNNFQDKTNAMSLLSSANKFTVGNLSPEQRALFIEFANNVSFQLIAKCIEAVMDIEKDKLTTIKRTFNVITNKDEAITLVANHKSKLVEFYPGKLNVLLDYINNGTAADKSNFITLLSDTETNGIKLIKAVLASGISLADVIELFAKRRNKLNKFSEDLLDLFVQHTEDTKVDDKKAFIDVLIDTSDPNSIRLIKTLLEHEIPLAVVIKLFKQQRTQLLKLDEKQLDVFLEFSKKYSYEDNVKLIQVLQQAKTPADLELTQASLANNKAALNVLSERRIGGEGLKALTTFNNLTPLQATIATAIYGIIEDRDLFQKQIEQRDPAVLALLNPAYSNLITLLHTKKITLNLALAKKMAHFHSLLFVLPVIEAFPENVVQQAFASWIRDKELNVLEILNYCVTYAVKSNVQDHKLLALQLIIDAVCFVKRYPDRELQKDGLLEMRGQFYHLFQSLDKANLIQAKNIVLAGLSMAPYFILDHTRGRIGDTDVVQGILGIFGSTRDLPTSASIFFTNVGARLNSEGQWHFNQTQEQQSFDSFLNSNQARLQYGHAGRFTERENFTLFGNRLALQSSVSNIDDVSETHDETLGGPN